MNSNVEPESDSKLICICLRVTGKEEMVDLYQEEAEVFKEKNYHHKERVNFNTISCIVN